MQHKALPAMIDRLMKEKDGQVRLAVLDALTALGPDAASAVPALVHTLRDRLRRPAAGRARTRIIVPPWRWRPSASPRSRACAAC